MTLWYERTDGRGPKVLLLHGLGATGAVWNGTVERLRARADALTIVVDLPGHGASSWRTTYSVGEMAAGIVPCVRDVDGLHVIGHSLGVYVGLALASSWFNCTVASVTGIGPKLTWTTADFARLRELARRAVKHFPTHGEALERYRRASGLDAQTAPAVGTLARGTVAEAEGSRLAADPATMAVGAPAFAGLISLARCPVKLARGERDAMVSLAELREYEPTAVDLEGSGHNAHVEAPDAIVDLFEAVRRQVHHGD